MRLIDAEAFYKAVEKEKKMLLKNGKTSDSSILVGGLQMVLEWINEQPTIEAKPVVRAHWISASWEEDEEEGIENTYSDEFICFNCKEHLYFPDAIEKEDIGFSFCPYCGAQMDEPISQTHENGVKIPVISMEDVPKLAKEMEK